VVLGLRFRAYGLWLMVQGLELRVEGGGIRAYGSWLMVQGVGFRVEGDKATVSLLSDAHAELEFGFRV